MPQTSVNNVTTQKMTDDHIQTDTFTSPLHHLPLKVQCSLDELFNSLNTNCTKLQTDSGTSDPVSQKPYPIAMNHYDLVKNEINKSLSAK